MKKLSSWTNVQDIFKANAGQGERMNNDVFGSLEAEGAKAQQGLDTASRGFNDKANRSYQGAMNSMSGKTADSSEAAGKQTYNGPRTLKEYDPNISSTIGDAAQRINSSAGAQFQNQYKGVGAAGSAMDMALMGQAGSEQRGAALKGTYGSLLAKLSSSEQQAQKFGEYAGKNVTDRALTMAAKAPGQRQDEAIAARAKLERDLYERNTRAREKYDKQWEQRNRNIGKGELQASYAPPEMEVLPYYPEE
jgi:hypothetical protein